MRLEANTLSPEMLEQFSGQANDVNDRSRDLFGQPVIPPSLDTAEGVVSLANMGFRELRAQFPKRMEIFSQMHKSEKLGSEFSQEQLDAASTWLTVLNSLDQYITDHQNDPENQTLHEMQLEAFIHLRDFLEKGNTDGYFKLPTSFGKTVLFTEFAEATQQRTLVVVPTLELLDQTEETFERFAPDVSLGKVYGKEKDYDQDVTVITYDSLIKQLKQADENPDDAKFRPEDYGVLILDEAHHSLGTERIKAVDRFKHAIRLGFTATPARSEDSHVRDLLNNEIYSITIKEAVKAGLLSDFKVWLAYTDTDLSSVSISRYTDDYDPRELDKAVNIAARNKSAVDLYESEFSGESALVYCVSVKHAQDVAAMFVDKGIRAEAVWGDMDYNERQRIIEEFRSGKIDVLCNMQLLTEGFNAPNASVCINLRPTLSPVVAEQRGGRVLRIDPNNLQKEATIVDFIDYSKSSKGIPVSFAEVAENPNVVRKLPKHDWKQKGEGKRTESEFEFEGLEVLTDVEEVMRVISENKILREIGRGRYPEGFEAVFPARIASESRLGTILVTRQLRILRDKNPDHIGGGGGNGVLYFADEEGQAIIKKHIDEMKLPDGFEKVPLEDMVERTRIERSLITNKLKELQKEHPEEITKAHYSGRPYYFSAEGRRLLDVWLEEMKLPEGFSYIPTKDLMDEYGVTYQQVTKRIDDLKKASPDHVKGGGGGKGTKGNRHFNADQEGLSLLRTELDKLRPPEGFGVVRTSALSEELGVGLDYVWKYLKELKEQFPEHFTGGERKPYFATDAGMSLLTERLKTTVLPDNFSLVPVVALGNEFHVTPSTIKNHIEKLKAKNPNEYMLRGDRRFRYSTERGVEMIKESLRASTRHSPPEGFLPISVEKIAQEYGLSISPVQQRVRRLARQHPEHFKGGGNNPYVVTSRGEELLRESLAHIIPPERFTQVPVLEMAAELGVSKGTIEQRLQNLRKLHPALFIRTGKAKAYFATTEGQVIVRASLEETVKPPEGYEKLVAERLAEEFNTGPTWVIARIKKLMAENPNDFGFRAAGHKFYYATERGKALLRTRIANDLNPQGFLSIAVSAIASERRVPKDKVRDTVAKLQNTNPEHFRVGRKGRASAATVAGISLLQTTLQTDERFTMVPSAALAKEVGIHVSSVSLRFGRLSKLYPDEFKKTENRELLATPRGIELLKANLKELIPPGEGFTPIDAQALADSQGIHRKVMNKKIYALMQENPDHFKYSAQQVYYATEQGQKLLDELLAARRVPDGFSSVPTIEMAEEYGVSLSPIYDAIAELKKVHPEHFWGGGQEFSTRGGHFSTAEGVRLLREKMDNRKK